MPRTGGFLVAVPQHFFTNDALLDGAMSDEGQLGPSREFTGPLFEEDDEGGEVAVGLDSSFMMVDVLDSALAQMDEYDPVTDPTSDVAPFTAIHPAAVVNLSQVVGVIQDWLNAVGNGTRMDFYTAREEPDPPKAAAPKKATKKVSTAVLAERIEALTAQMQFLAAQQQAAASPPKQNSPRSVVPAGGQGLGQGFPSAVPPVSQGMALAPHSAVAKVAQLVGPPPRSKAAPGAPQGQLVAGVAPGAETEPEKMGVMTQALMDQSSAITALVAHLASGDPVGDLAASSSSATGGHGLNMRGVARRERMQRELAEGSSSYFLQFHQQLFRKMHPARPVPRTEQEIAASQVTMTSYLERFGNYKQNREGAMILWSLAHCVDCAAMDDLQGTREHLALLCASLDQACHDGNWSVAWVLNLLDEPPSSMFQEKPPSVSNLGRPFAGMVPGQWAAASLAYLKEMELLSSKKTEAKPAKAPAAAKAEDATNPSSPKRKPRFPKKPKAGADAPPKDQ
eukprot:Skav209437  [mRNA]  locus=scaffold805:194561:196087:- [translate_table: standard]